MPRYVQVKLVLQHNKFFVESPDAAILKRMLKDPIIKAARVGADAEDGPSGFEARSLSYVSVQFLALYC